MKGSGGSIFWNSTRLVDGSFLQVFDDVNACTAQSVYSFRLSALFDNSMILYV